MDESRKAFESEIEHSYGEDFLVVNDDGDYANWITADLWEFWVKSRSAIEIELPKVIVTGFEQIDSKLLAAYMGLNQIKQAIRAAGIKVKE